MNGQAQHTMLDNGLRVPVGGEDALPNDSKDCCSSIAPKETNGSNFDDETQWLEVTAAEESCEKAESDSDDCCGTADTFVGPEDSIGGGALETVSPTTEDIIVESLGEDAVTDDTALGSTNTATHPIASLTRRNGHDSSAVDSAITSDSLLEMNGTAQHGMEDTTTIIPNGNRIPDAPPHQEDGDDTFHTARESFVVTESTAEAPGEGRLIEDAPVELLGTTTAVAAAAMETHDAAAAATAVPPQENITINLVNGDAEIASREDAAVDTEGHDDDFDSAERSTAGDAVATMTTPVVDHACGGGDSAQSSTNGERSCEQQQDAPLAGDHAGLGDLDVSTPVHSSSVVEEDAAFVGDFAAPDGECSESAAQSSAADDDGVGAAEHISTGSTVDDPASVVEDAFDAAAPTNGECSKHDGASDVHDDFGDFGAANDPKHVTEEDDFDAAEPTDGECCSDDLGDVDAAPPAEDTAAPPKEGALEEDEFGDFGTADHHPVVATEESGFASQEEDEFGDFGAAEPGVVGQEESAVAALDDTEDDFGDFGTAAPAEPTQELDADDDFGEFDAAQGTTTDDGFDDDDDFGDFEEVSPVTPTDSAHQQQTIPAEPSIPVDPLLQKYHTSIPIIFESYAVSEKRPEQPSAPAESVVSIGDVLAALDPDASAPARSTENPPGDRLLHSILGTPSSSPKPTEPSSPTTSSRREIPRIPNPFPYPIGGFTYRRSETLSCTTTDAAAAHPNDIHQPSKRVEDELLEKIPDFSYMRATELVLPASSSNLSSSIV